MEKYDWNEIAFKNKSFLDDYIFIAGSRDISLNKILTLIKENIKKGNLVFGILKEDYIDGFEGQVQFQSLKIKKLEKVLSAFKSLPGKVCILEYFQRDVVDIVDKIDFRKIIFIRGSYKGMLHTRREFFTAFKKGLKLSSPFINEKEAKNYVEKVYTYYNGNVQIDVKKNYTNDELMEITEEISKRSFDYTGQVGSILSRNGKILCYSHNEVLPFETYALLNGSLREENYVKSGELGYFDTIHAEMNVLMKALKKGINIKDTNLFVNVMPCPNCAKAIAKSGIKNVFYRTDYNTSYTYELLDRENISLVKI